jgi:hypothetical protein
VGYGTIYMDGEHEKQAGKYTRRYDLMTTRTQRQVVTQIAWGSKTLRSLLDHVLQGNEAQAMAMINGELSKPIELVETIMGKKLTREERMLYLLAPEHVPCDLQVAMQYGHYWENLIKAVRSYLNPACRSQMPQELAHADIIARLRIFVTAVQNCEVRFQ